MSSDDPTVTSPGDTRAGQRPSRSVPALPELKLPPELADRFAPIALLGRGGMGVVYLVRDRRLERDVALKLMRFESERLAGMFRAEARLLAGLEHDNVVRLYELGDAPSAGGQYILMEFVRGRSLAARLAEGRPTLVQAAAIAVDILRGVAEAHARGIVHRDLKPANVFLEPSGRAKVADFGLAVQARDHAVAPGRIVGTPGYMAPEQARAEAVGTAADVYAAGVVLHEMLTGRRLFSGPSAEAILRAQQDAHPAPPSRANPSVPAALDDLVGRALAHDPAERPSAAVLGGSLEAWLERVTRARKPAGGALPAHPYKLLQPFATQDAAVYFGRDAEVLELVELVDHPEIRLITLFGPCGIGKSSLVRAGLVPALDPARFEPVVLMGGTDPAAVLRAALARDPGGRTPVLVVDQAEEVFTLNAAGSPRAAGFFRLVADILEEPAGRAKLIVSFRTEFRGAFWPLEERHAHLHRAFAVREIERPGVVEAIEGPARIEAYGFSWEDDLPGSIADDVLATATAGGDAALPILQIVCAQLLDRTRGEGARTITARTYREAVGGARGALERYVEARVASPEYEHHGAMARQMLRALTLKEEGGERFAREREEDELLAFPDREAARHTLERLIRDHLVLRYSSGEGPRKVRLASEVICPLIDAWQLEPDDAERAARTLARAYARWLETGRADEDLLAGAALRLVERQLPDLGDLGADERTFVTQSVTRRRRRVIAASSLFLAIAAIVGGLFWTAFLRPGKLELTSDPPGAQVHAGDTLLGRTPLAWPAQPGVHALRLTAVRHDPTTVSIEIPAGGATGHHAVLRYPHGVLAMSSDPQGALCTVRPPAAGAPPVASRLRTPFTTEVAAGTYRVEVELAGHAPAVIEDVEIRPNRVMTQLAPKLTRVTGRLAIRSPFPGAQALLTSDASGEALGPFPLPMAERELAAGGWRLDVSGPLVLSSTQRVTLTAGARLSATAWAPFVKPLWEAPVKGAVYGAPALANLDGDRALDAVVVVENEVRALAGRDGRDLWSVALPDVSWSSPHVVDLDGDASADVVLGANDGVLRALEGKSGRVLWTHATRAQIVSSPAEAVLDADAVPDVVVGSDDRAVHAVSGATGKPIWTYETGGRVRSSPCAADLDRDGVPEILVGSGDGKLYALDAKDGRPRWSYAAGGEVNATPCAGDLDGDGRLDVVVGARDKGVHAVAADGRKLWVRFTGDEVRASTALTDVDGDGVLDVIAGSFDQHLYALRGRDGQVLWKRRTGEQVIASPVLADLDEDGAPEILIGGREGVLRAYDRASGAPVMQRPLGGPVSGAVALADLDDDGARDVVVAAWFHRVSAFRGRTPRARWAAQLADAGLRIAPPAAADLDADAVPDLVVGAADGGVRALCGRDGRELWSAAVEGAVPGAAALVACDEDAVPDAVVAVAEGGLRALSGRNGRRLWEVPTGPHFRSAPVSGTFGGARSPGVAVGARDGTVLAVAVRDGRVLWRGQAGAAIAHPPLVTAVDEDAVDDVVVGIADRKLVALSGASGAVLWTAPLPGDPLTAPFLATLRTMPGPQIVVAAGDGTVAGITPRTGAIAWSRTVPGGVEALAAVSLDAAAGADLVAGTRAGRVVALTGGAGTVAWSAECGSPVQALSAAELDERKGEDVLAVCEDGRLHALAGGSGTRLAAYDLLAGTLVPARVMTLAPDRSAVLVAAHAGSTLVALPLSLPIAPRPAPEAFSFTSGRGRWRH